MILKYGAKNFLSFNEGIEVPFELNSNCPDHISEGKSYTNILCVKGANGSGKTNVLKILEFLNDFCCDSFSNKPDEEINCQSFFNNHNPIEFYVEFMIKNIQYKYELSLSKNHVLNETLYRKSKRWLKVLERSNNQISYNINDFADVKIVKLRSNASIISTANQYEIKSLLDIYNFFDSIRLNIGAIGTNTYLSLSSLSKFYFNSPESFQFVKNIIYKCDLGINDLEIIKSEDTNRDEQYFPIFYHKYNNKNQSLTFFAQSSGTKALFNQLWKYKIVLENGGILVLDEFDINLHPHILPMLINLFTSSETNPHYGQIIFTTHNTEIMDTLGKYRLFLVNKENNESFGYRLDELPGEMLRNDRYISPIYNEGKIGGIPKI